MALFNRQLAQNNRHIVIRVKRIAHCNGVYIFTRILDRRIQAVEPEFAQIGGFRDEPHHSGICIAVELYNITRRNRNTSLCHLKGSKVFYNLIVLGIYRTPSNLIFICRRADHFLATRHLDCSGFIILKSCNCRNILDKRRSVVSL